MSEVYIVWCMDVNLRLKNGLPVTEYSEESLAIWPTEEEAEEAARDRYIKGLDELTLVVRVQPYSAPVVISLTGSMSGKLACDGYDLRWAIEANVEAIKQVLLRDYSFTRRQKEVV